MQVFVPLRLESAAPCFVRNRFFQGCSLLEPEVWTSNIFLVISLIHFRQVLLKYELRSFNVDEGLQMIEFGKGDWKVNFKVKVHFNNIFCHLLYPFHLKNSSSFVFILHISLISILPILQYTSYHCLLATGVSAVPASQTCVQRSVQLYIA